MGCDCTNRNASNEAEAGRRLNAVVNTLMLARLIEGRTQRETLTGGWLLANTREEVLDLSARDFAEPSEQIRLVKNKDDLIRLRESSGDSELIISMMSDEQFEKFANGALFADKFERGRRHRYLAGVNLQPVLDFRGDYEDVFEIMRMFGWSERYTATNVGWVVCSDIGDPKCKCCPHVSACGC